MQRQLYILRDTRLEHINKREIQLKPTQMVVVFWLAQMKMTVPQIWSEHAGLYLL